ncbi:MarR family winged helix-turn-helix transcriptional regulator [Macrococcoides caseolyticum]|uniref:MarR family winged helix-turn-helix transcriptional regulator n=1 Tax=Macrococcoides caseolyticum TaxID=69966 RepID=UPI001F3DCE09|nr:MarR family transcriptional regulator [Macrococcus caseolyticus]MCE4955908.1 MarR family transcriptional regulator [Macrococcus caseolyticus]
MPNHTLDYQMYLAQREVINFYNRHLLKQKQLTYQQYLVIMVLHESGTIPVLQLGHRLAFQSGTISPILKKMEIKGIIERYRNPDDERVVMIQLSEEGRLLSQELIDIPLQMFKASGLTPQEYKKLMIYASKVIQNVTY